jgi:hypothetical protein
MKKRHTLSYCELCKIDMVICGTCGNNCCNGGYGIINNEKCTGCDNAYDIQAQYYKLLNDKSFKAEYFKRIMERYFNEN